MSTTKFLIPEISLTKQLIERIHFSVASRNAQAKVCESAAHVFGSPFVDSPSDITWRYVTSGVACLLRSKELAPNKRKYVWSLQLCLYNALYGVLVWKVDIGLGATYTLVGDNFHVFALNDYGGIIGILFGDTREAREFGETYSSWHAERMRDEKARGSPTPVEHMSRFRKEMISKPCNFQHIQGTQAIDECLEIERIKEDIQSCVQTLALQRSRGETAADQKRKKKKEQQKPRLEFEKVEIPEAAKAKVDGGCSNDGFISSMSPVPVPDDCQSPVPPPNPGMMMTDNYQDPPHSAAPVHNYPPPPPPPPVLPFGIAVGDPQQQQQVVNGHAPLSPPLSPLSPPPPQEHVTMAYHSPTPDPNDMGPGINYDYQVGGGGGGGGGEGGEDGYLGTKSPDVSFGSDIAPPGRLSPLNLEKEFTQSELFQSAFTTRPVTNV